MADPTNTITRGMVEAIAAKLRDLPSPEARTRAVTKREAIRLLRKEIRSLQQRGYTIAQIAELLSAEGVSFTAPTLSNLLWRAERERRSTGQAAVRRRRGDTPAARPRESASQRSFTPVPDSEDI